MLDDADASAALTTLGVSTFAKSLLDDADASAALTTLGAQASLGYTAANKAGETFTGNVFTSKNRGSPSPGNYVDGHIFRSRIEGSAYATFFAQEVVGTVSRAVLEASNGFSKYPFFYFDENGNFSAPGSINGASKNFLIDHPLDPFNRDLIFASTESPHYGVEAWGVARLEGGRVTIDIDAASNLTTGTWAALAQNTVVTSLQNQEGFARLRPSPVAGGQFEIIADDDACGDLVAWRVVADRNDPVVKTLGNADPETGLLIPEADKEELA